jgi:hypothetical protein
MTFFLVLFGIIGLKLSRLNISIYLDPEDFTPARGSTSTPDHQMQTFAARLTVDTPNPSLTDKKQRLLELLQEK